MRNILEKLVRLLVPPRPVPVPVPTRRQRVVRLLERGRRKS